MASEINLLIADDHQMFIDGIKALLNDIPYIRIAGEANTGEAVMELLKTNPTDMILMDIGMPGLNGIETTALVTQKYPHIKVIALTMYDDRNRIIKMLKAGAQGYILKNTSKTELLQAIEALAKGGTYYSPHVQASITNEETDQKFDPVANLTKREIEVIKLVMKSMTNKEIANLLFVSELTINTHRKNAMQKLKVKNTAGLVKFAMDHNLDAL